MNWEMISAIGQMLGALGVIISLVYLAVQIRAQKKESERAAVTSLTTQFNEFMRPQIESSELCAIWLRGLKSFEQLDGPSKLRFGSHIGRQLRAADSLYLAYRDGTLDARVWRGFERSLADIAAYPGFQSWWPTRKHWYSDEFRALLDGHIQTGKPTIYEDYI
jgi:hypothetical protein